MFDFAWTEIALIGVVAMVLIGPKDMPIAIKAVADMVKKARRMAGEFQTHVDEMVRDTDLKDVRDSISEIRRMDIGGEIRRTVDPDGTVRAAFKDDPFRASPSITTPPAGGDAAELATTEAGHVTLGPVATPPAAPAFVPPSFIPPAPIAAAVPALAAPAFIPPASASAGPMQHGG